ncbi:MAG: hypothetical protein II187_06090, partial [Treponema sp.]|nr:hypothetical protein [Treponema sp.]
MAKKELDRFDTSARRDIRLSTKLIGLIGGFILLGCSIVATISLTVFDSKLIQNTQAELEYTEQGARNVMQDWLSTLALSADLLSETPAVIQAAAQSGDSALASSLKQKVSDLDL